MGLLDQVVGNVVGQVLGGGRGGAALSPIARALLMLLVSKGVSGGLGSILGGGQAAPQADDGAREDRGRSDPERDDAPGGGTGDLGGFGGRTTGGSGPLPQDGDYSDLAGMLDGPNQGAGQGRNQAGDRAPGAGPYAHLDREPDEASGDNSGGGLGGLIAGFERSGLGDVIGSWIGGGQNRALAPNRLADALGPDTVETLSRQTGLDRSDLLAQLAQALPSVVDALTPHGRPPHPDEQRHW